MTQQINRSKKVEVMESYKTDYYNYQLDRISEGTNRTIVLRILEKSPYGVRSVIKYQDVGVELVSQYLNWKNLIFCSNNYGVAPDCAYMNYAVQNGTKTAATAYYCGNDERQRIIDTLPADCHAADYGSGMLYVYRDGSLDSLFGFEQVKRIYSAHMIQGIDWSKVKQYFEQPLSFFGNESECGFSLQSGGGRDESIVVGLLLGYPIESTVACFLSNDNIFSTCPPPEVRQHFKNSDKPFRHLYISWVKENGEIIIDGQQEGLYY